MGHDLFQQLQIYHCSDERSDKNCAIYFKSIGGIFFKIMAECLAVISRVLGISLSDPIKHELYITFIRRRFISKFIIGALN